MRFAQNILYSLKRKFPAKITLYKTLSSVVDTRTGVRVIERKVVHVQFAIVLPDTLSRKFDKRAHILERKVTWDQSQRTVIIDGVDLPVGFTIDMEMSVVFNDERYVVKTAERLDAGFGYILTILRAENNFPLQIFDLIARNEICLGQLIDHES